MARGRHGQGGSFCAGAACRQLDAPGPGRIAQRRYLVTAEGHANALVRAGGSPNAYGLALLEDHVIREAPRQLDRWLLGRHALTGMGLGPVGPGKEYRGEEGI